MAEKTYKTTLSVKVVCNEDSSVLFDMPDLQYPAMQYEDVVFFEQSLLAAFSKMAGDALDEKKGKKEKRDR